MVSLTRYEFLSLPKETRKHLGKKELETRLEEIQLVESGEISLEQAQKNARSRLRGLGMRVTDLR